MAKTVEKEKKVAAATNSGGQGALLVEAIKGAISSGLAPLVTELKAASDGMNSLRNDVEELKGLHLIQAAASREDADEDEISAKAEDEEEMSASKEDDEEASAADDKKKDDEEDNADDGDDEESESDDLDAMEDLEKEAADPEPGEVNEDASSKGDKSTVTNAPKQGAKVSGNIAKGRLKSAGLKAGKPFPGLKSSSSIQAAAVMIETLNAQVHKLGKQNRRLVNQLNAQSAEFQKEMKKFRNRYSAMEAQAERWAEQVDRRSQVPTDLTNLMSKANVDPREIMAGNSEKMSVQAVDQMFKLAAEQGIVIDPTMRATYKNRMNEMGLMESGEVPYSVRN